MKPQQRRQKATPKPPQQKLSRWILKSLGILLCLALISAFVFSSSILRYGTDKIVWAIARYNSPTGITQIKPWYRDVYYSFPASVQWNDVGASFTIKSSSLGERAFLVRGKTARLDFTSLLRGNALLSLKNGELSSGTQRSRLREAGFDNKVKGFLNGKILYASFPLNNIYRDPLQSVRESIDGLSKIASGSSSSIPYQFKGFFQLDISEKSYPCQLSIVQLSDGHKLAIDKSDIQKIIKSFSSTDYSDQEIDIIVEHPLKAPMLLQIKQYARQRADELHEIDPDLPVDPYRHVLWSFLLTKSFGAEFAHRVTDAHEERQKHIAGSDSFRDYQNNDVGRQYALRGLPESVLAMKVKTDPLVRR